MNINTQLGMRIAFLRKQRGWSQEELSFECGVNKNYLSDLERGRRNPSLKIMQRIADSFEINLETLFKGIEVLK